MGRDAHGQPYGVIDMLDLLKSKTIWGVLVMLAGAVLHIFGFNMTEADQADLTHTLAIVADGVGSLIAVIGRIKAKGPIKIGGGGAALVLAFVIMGGLSACAGTNATRATNALGIACNAYAAALDKLADRKAGLTVAMVERVNTANRVVDPVCSPNSPFDPAAGVAIVENAITIIQGIK